MELYGVESGAVNMYEVIGNSNNQMTCTFAVLNSNTNFNKLGLETDWNSAAWGGLHIQTTQELFYYATMYPAQFVGTELNNVRSTTVDHYVSTVSGTTSAGTINFAIHYYWLSGSWTTVGSSGSVSIPSQVIIMGTEVYNGVTYNISRYYEYVNFLPTPPAVSTWNFNPSWNCTPCWSFSQVCPDGTCAGQNNATLNYYPCCSHGGVCASSSSSTGKPDAGWTILLLFIGLVVGLVGGAIAVVVWLRRKELFKKAEFLNQS